MNQAEHMKVLNVIERVQADFNGLAERYQDFKWWIEEIKRTGNQEDGRVLVLTVALGVENEIASTKFISVDLKIPVRIMERVCAEGIFKQVGIHKILEIYNAQHGYYLYKAKEEREKLKAKKKREELDKCFM